MILNIDGNRIDTIVNTHKDELNKIVLGFIENNEGFYLEDEKQLGMGLIVLPSHMITYDISTKTLTKHEVVDQMQWVIACAVIVFEKARPLNRKDKKLLLAAIEEKKKVQKPDEAKIILLN